MDSSNAPKDAQQEPEEEERSGIYMEFEPSKDPVVISTARRVRQIGFTIAGLLTLWVSTPVVIAVVSGVSSGTVVDPISKRPVAADYRLDDCRQWGLELIKNGGADKDRADWKTRCGSANPDLLIKVP